MALIPWFHFCVIGILLAAPGTGRHSGDRFCSCGFTLSFLRVPWHRHSRFLANALLRELNLFSLSVTVSERMRYTGTVSVTGPVRRVARYTEGLVPREADGYQGCSDFLKGDPSSWMRGKGFYDEFRGSAPESGDPYRNLPVTDPLISAKHRRVYCKFCSVLTWVSLTPNYMHSEQLSRPAQSFAVYMRRADSTGPLAAVLTDCALWQEPGV